MKAVLNTILKILLGIMIPYTVISNIMMAIIIYKMQAAPGLFDKLDVVMEYQLLGKEGFVISVLIFNSVLLLLLYNSYVRKVRLKRNILN